jgi:hypothetical protein
VARLTIQVTGLRELRAQLRAADAALPKQIRVALNKSAELVISYARPHIPHKTGRAAASLKVRSSQTTAAVAAGGSRAPYYPFLDFGGSVGRRKSVHRPFLTQGRYVYPGLRANRDHITEVMSAALTEVARSAGFEVT